MGKFTEDQKIKQMRKALLLAREALDNLMGDSDLPEDDSLEMKAMQAIAKALKGKQSTQHEIVYSLEDKAPDPLMLIDGKPAILLVFNFVMEGGRGASSILSPEQGRTLAQRMVNLLNAEQQS